MATVKDVAKEAGVSTATVSRVLNQCGSVHVRTRARVEEAIRALKYHPSRVARRLRVKDQSASMLGLVIPDLQNPFFSELARGVEDVAYEHQHALIVCNSEENAKKEAFYLRTMRAESVDGIILPMADEQSEILRQLLHEGKPIVCVDRQPARICVDTVLADSVRGAYIATERLIGLGHRRIGIITGLPHLSTSRDRVAGYRRAFQDYGVPFDPVLVCEGDSRRQSGCTLGLRLLDLPEPPTAIFPCNNMMTLGALEAIRRRNLRIPDDVALIGFDDVPWAKAFSPPLTVVRQPSYEMGRRAAQLLLERINAPRRPPATHVMQPELIIRNSCCPGRRGIEPEA